MLMDRIDGRMAGRKRGSYAAGGMRGHDERAAQRLLVDAVNRLGVKVQDLWGRRQTDAVKQAVAWWIKSRTFFGDEWICRKLEMGNRVNVCRAVRRYRAAADPNGAKLR